jgi:hypothetical protein
VKLNKECRKAGRKKNRVQTPSLDRPAIDVRQRLEPSFFELSFAQTTLKPKRVIAA